MGKANALQAELEESRALLDSADRSKKQADMELAEARSAVNDMTTINSKAASEKRHLESAIHTMHAEIDDMLHSAKGSEEKAKKAWLMLQGLLMSSVLNKIMLLHRRRASAP